MSRSINTFYCQHEIARCPNEACDSSIPHECIAANTDAATGVRTIRALCPNCDRLWMARVQFTGMAWQYVEPVKEITDSRLKAQFHKRVEHARGVIQRKDLPPVKVAG